MYKIKKVEYLSMKHIYNTLIILFLICCMQGCSMYSPLVIDKDTLLKKRVESAYQYWKDRQGDKFMNLYHDQVHKKMSEKEKVDEFEKRFGILLEYNIKEIEIIGEKAKVKIECTVKLENKNKEPTESLILYDKHIDHWIFQDNEWYLFEFSKAW